MFSPALDHAVNSFVRETGQLSTNSEPLHSARIPVRRPIARAWPWKEQHATTSTSTRAKVGASTTPSFLRGSASPTLGRASGRPAISWLRGPGNTAISGTLAVRITSCRSSGSTTHSLTCSSGSQRSLARQPMGRFPARRWRSLTELDRMVRILSSADTIGPRASKAWTATPARCSGSAIRTAANRSA